MEDEASSSLDGKVLTNLRVVDLKQELEKRGLSKSGSKKDLVKRLKQQIEFEKLCEEKKTGEFDRKIELDAATEQNEFVKQYLALQQRRLEAQAQQKPGSEGEISNENQEDFIKDDNSDIDVEDSETDEPFKNTESTETKDEITVPVAENCGPVALQKTSNGSSVKNEELNKPPSPKSLSPAKKVSPEPKCLQSDQMYEAEENQNNTPNLESVIEDNEAVKNIPLPSPALSEEEIIEDSESISKNQKHTSEDISSPNASVSIERDIDNAALEGTALDLSSQDRLSASISQENHHVTDSKENYSNSAHSSDLMDQTHDVAAGSNSDSNATIEDTKKELLEHTSSQGCSSLKNLCEKYLMANMEPSECSSVNITEKVPYSLSDIQLPESPGHHLKSKELNNDENSNNTNVSTNIVEDQKSPSNLKVQSNGMSAIDNENSNGVSVSDNETKESVKNSVSPEKPRGRKESVDSRQTDESSEVESEKDTSQNKKSPKREDSSSNIISDSKEEIVSKETTNKEHKSSKHHHQSYESDKSSDSDKYKPRRADLKHKTRVKHRKRNRRSRSQSSSSSSSHSSDSSPKRRHSKKSVITHKSKSYTENVESNELSDKKIEKPKVQNNLTVLNSLFTTSVHSGEFSKKRPKIKRDNVVLEVNTPNIESVESTSSKADETSKSDVDSTIEKPPKEITEIKLSLSDLPYVPRKVSLSNRKLNRKSSEDQSNEPKPKKSKWESFAASQKASSTISICTDSLKNWFPDFKLMSEPSSSMELEPDEHSVPAIDEKSSNTMHTDVSYRIDAGLKQDSVSQLEMEDSESQEPKFEDSIEQGPVSKIIFIQNLVRPFTLGQLKDLLKQNGNIVEEHFWIDKIKSKCFVVYETEKEAIKAKNALHNARWPLSNPKILTVEFSNFEELELHKKGNEVPPKPVIPETPAVQIPEENEPRASYSGDENKRRERERRKEKDRSKGMPPVREWDKDKVLQDSPERERIIKEEKSRSSDKKEKKESKKRPNEDTPAKLLDDLFQKTKNPPCIYWLPLTEEQAKQKDEAKKLRKLEREKRNQQLKEQEEAERRSKRARSSRRSREKENRKSSTRSRSPVNRRR